MSDRMSGAGSAGPEEDLTSCDDIQGRNVYGAEGEEIGSVEKLMIDGKAGRLAYAVVKLGGPITTGTNYYPVPWRRLEYDARLGGYRARVTREQLAEAPSYSEGEHPWSEAEYCRRLGDYYGTLAG
jgi:sporulation protein YlmC with PRC-barrel domain